MEDLSDSLGDALNFMFRIWGGMYIFPLLKSRYWSNIIPSRDNIIKLITFPICTLCTILTEGKMWRFCEGSHIHTPCIDIYVYISIHTHTLYINLYTHILAHDYINTSASKCIYINIYTHLRSDDNCLFIVCQFSLHIWLPFSFLLYISVPLTLISFHGLGDITILWYSSTCSTRHGSKKKYPQKSPVFHP